MPRGFAGRALWGVQGALLFLSALLSAAESPMRFERISVAEGLSESAVSFILQDRQGFLWVATHDGLNQYDGYTFKIFKHRPNDQWSIVDSAVRVIAEDHLGTLWAGTWDKGVERLDRRTGLWSHYRHRASDPQTLSGDKIAAIYEDSQRVLWVGTDKGLNRYIRGGDRFQRCGPVAGVSVNAICEDHAGRLWLGTANGLMLLDARRRLLRRFRCQDGKPDSLGDNWVVQILEDSRGNVWVSTVNGLSRFASDSLSCRTFRPVPGDERSLSHPFATSLFEDRNGRLWVGTYGGGLNRLDADGGFTRITHRPDDDESLGHDRVTHVISDRSGIIWIGTEGGGLSKFVPRRAAIRLFRNRANDPDSLSHNFITALDSDAEGRIWVGTGGGGLNVFNPAGERFRRFRKRPGMRESLSSDFVSALRCDPRGFVWIGTKGGGLCRFDCRNERFFQYAASPPPLNLLARALVNSLFLDRRGVLWIGTDDVGLFAFNPELRQLTQFRHDPADGRSISSDSVNSLFETPGGEFWVGTQAGLDRFDRPRGKFAHFRSEPARPQTLSHNWAWCIFEDSRGILWVGTYGGGLNRFERATGTFRRYGELEGLANDVVYGIIEDSGGFLWISTNRGLSRFDPRSGLFRNYDAGDGLQSNEFNSNAYARDRSGRLYFGGINGLNCFSPDEIRVNPTPPQPAITSFRVFNRVMLLPPPAAARPSVTLSYRQNFFSLEFSALDFTAPEKNRYAHMLEGLDREWIDSGRRRYAAYTNLDPGRYRFRVRAANNDGVWNEAGVSLGIVIQPPFWRTAWFAAAAALALLGALLAVLFFTVRYIRLLKANVNAERFAAVGRFASYFAHDLKSPLEGSYLLASATREMCAENDTRRRPLDDLVAGLDRLRGLVRGALDLSKATCPQLESTDLNGIVRSAADEFRRTHDCEIDFALDPMLPALGLDAPLIRRVLLNLFENSFQFRRETCRIHIESGCNDQRVQLSVADNGQGMDRKLLPVIFEPFTSGRESDGFGLAFVRETVIRHGGRISVESEKGWGTTFLIEFPRPDAGKREK
ncbi:MAG TPA: two-component regulator propeller domain-containing protein [Candidatus Aminicenantes bacterium]|nr:two-component regulator propeller domain-containing protein [Candidatus Aminicenantes bacterium]